MNGGSRWKTRRGKEIDNKMEREESVCSSSSSKKPRQKKKIVRTIEEKDKVSLFLYSSSTKKKEVETRDSFARTILFCRKKQRKIILERKLCKLAKKKKRKRKNKETINYIRHRETRSICRRGKHVRQLIAQRNKK